MKNNLKSSKYRNEALFKIFTKEEQSRQLESFFILVAIVPISCLLDGSFDRKLTVALKYGSSSTSYSHKNDNGMEEM
jgi:hypothetical protein